MCVYVKHLHQKYVPDHYILELPHYLRQKMALQCNSMSGPIDDDVAREQCFHQFVHSQAS